MIEIFCCISDAQNGMQKKACERKNGSHALDESATVESTETESGKNSCF